MNDEEKDVYIKGKIKDEFIPEKIDNLFNNSIKIIENKGEVKMEENLNMNQNQEPNQNNQNQTEKKKMPVALKRVLATAACLTVLVGGGNIYASTQGYDNIFFLIGEKLGLSKDVFGKEEILSDRDITISYKPIEISEGTLIQINSLVIKDNEAKLKIHVDEKNAKKIITPLTYKVKDENDVELCNYTSVHSQTHTDFKEELVLNNYKNDTKKLILEIYDLNREKMVELEIDLEKKEINIIGNQEEVTKISEEELKKYLGAFAMLDYNGTEYDREMTANEKKTITALLIAENNGINVDAGLYAKNNTDVKRVLDKDKVHAFIKSFTDLELNENGVMDFSSNGVFYTQTYKGQLQYVYELDEIGCKPTCLEVTDIAYIGGIYNVTFKFCYSTEENKGFVKENTVEDLPVYEMSVGLILDEDNEYSKYRVSSMSEVTLLEKETEDKDDIDLSDSVISNTHKNTIQGFLNIISAHEATSVGMLQIKEIALIKDYEEWSQICNINERDAEGYVKTPIKYLELKNKMLAYMSEGLFETYSYSYKNVDGILWVRETGASGYSEKVESIKMISSSENNITYEVVISVEAFDGREKSRNEEFELQKNENGKYVVSAWGWHIELKETLQNYLDLSGAYEGSPVNLLLKLNLLKTENIIYTDENTDAEGYVKTNIKYSDYKKAMLDYVSESWFNEKFASLYKEKDGYLYYLNGRGTGMQFEVESVTLKGGQYIGTIYNVTFEDETGSKGEQQYREFNVEKHNGKYVISYCN